MSEDASPEAGPTLAFLLAALGSTVVSLQIAPAGTQLPIRSATLLDADDLGAAESGDLVADLCVLAGVSGKQATAWIGQLATADPAGGPIAVLIKDASPQLCRAAEAAGIAVGALHAQARAEMVLSTVRSLLVGAAARSQPDANSGEPFTEESDLYGLAQRVALLSGGLVSIEDDQSRLLAYSATDGEADELRMMSILGREGPAEHLRWLRELGVFERLRKSAAVVEVPADEGLGWRRRLVVSIQPVGVAGTGRAGSGQSGGDRPGGGRSGGGRSGGGPLGTIWLQEGARPLDPDASSVLEGAAAVAARLIHRARSAPTQEALQIQRLLGIRGGGVDVPSLAAGLAVPTSGPAAVVGVALTDTAPAAFPVSEIAAALRLHAGAYARESLVTATTERIYLLIPRVRSSTLAMWVEVLLDRLTARFGPALRAAIAAPVPSLGDVPAARAEVDRVLDGPSGLHRVTTLTQSRTPVLLGEIADLVGSRAELRDPRLQILLDYDSERDASLVETLEQYFARFGDVRGAASELHIHPNTLRYRLGRAERVLGMSLDDPDARLLLQIQLLALRRRP